MKPSTGAIRAVANNPATGFNAAMQGTQAPGSTLKIVTAAMLLEKGLISSNGPAPCPRTASTRAVRSTTWTTSSCPDSSSFATSFARSCNTAFIKLIDDTRTDDAALPKEARDVFGLGRRLEDRHRLLRRQRPGSPAARRRPVRSARAPSR